MNSAWRRRLLWLHRWIGGACALFLVVLSLTGLALNHSSRLGLDRVMVTAGWLLQRYGMTLPPPETTVSVSGHYAAIIEGELWFDGTPLAPLETITGGVAGDGWILIGGVRKALLITPEGELIDILAYPEKVEAPRWGTVDAVAAIESGDQRWVVRTSLDGWEMRDGGVWASAQPEECVLPESVFAQWKSGYAGSGLSLYRVLLDIHAGRFFGLPGTLLMDATAAAILYLCFSGLGVWWSRRKQRQRGRG